MRINDVISELNRSVRPDELWGEKYHISSAYGAVEIEVGEFLYSFVRCLKPKIILETGTAHGYSALHMGQALKDNGFGILYSCDIDPNCIVKSRSRIAQADLAEHVEIIHCAGVDIIKNTGVTECDMIFLDSDCTGTHPYELVKSEFFALKDYLIEGGFVLLHDVVCCDGPKKLFNENVSTGWWDKMIIPTCRGLGVLRNHSLSS